MADNIKRDANSLARDIEKESKKGERKTKNFLSDIPEDYKKVAVVAAAIALTVFGVKTYNDKHNKEPEEEAKSNVKQAKNKVKDIFK